MCRNSFVQHREFRRVRCYLTTDVSILVANGLISNHLDYCNWLFKSLSQLHLCKLQCIQNSAARIVTNTCKFSSITPILIELHWLPVKQRLTYKINVITYKALCNMAPVYITELIQRYVPERQELRSASKQLLKRKRSRLKCGGDRAFSVCAPKLWNELPLSLKTSPSLEVFKNNLKTHLFKMAFNWTL